MNFKNERVLVIIGAILIVGLAIGLPFLSKPSNSLEPNFALSQLAFSAVAFFIVFLTLYFTIIQLRKSMEKPELKVAFSENGSQEIHIPISTKDSPEHQINLWILNKGTAIAELFQIDFVGIPEIYHPKIDSHIEGTVFKQINNKRETLSFINKRREHICFVNKPTQIPSLLIKTGIENHTRHNSPLIIPYNIFGDWGNLQKGQLKIVFDKAKE